MNKNIFLFQIIKNQIYKTRIKGITRVGAITREGAKARTLGAVKGTLTPPLG